MPAPTNLLAKELRHISAGYSSTATTALTSISTLRFAAEQVEMLDLAIMHLDNMLAKRPGAARSARKFLDNLNQKVAS